jgi:hypothetical protein
MAIYKDTWLVAYLDLTPGMSMPQARILTSHNESKEERALETEVST